MAFSMWDHLTKQRAWSRATFGPNFRPKGIIDHVRKECDEVLADPTDLEEWIDLAFLAFDGALHIATPQQVIDALQAKLAKNEAREWPDWTTMDPDKAIEHDRKSEFLPKLGTQVHWSLVEYNTYLGLQKLFDTLTRTTKA